MDLEKVIKQANLSSLKDYINSDMEVYDSVKIMDNMSNIQRIMLVSKNACIKSINLNNNSFLLKGVMGVQIIYLGENGEIASISNDTDFSLDLGDGKEWDTQFFLNAKITNLDVKIVKDRRIEYTGNINISGPSFVSEKINLLNEHDKDLGLEVMLKKDKYSIFDTVSNKESYTFKKDISYEENVNIMYAKASLSNISTNASGVGVLYSAKADVDLIYETGFDEKDIKVEKMSFPINHFIEKEPNFKCDFYSVNGAIESLVAEYKMDEDSAYIEMNLDLVSHALFSENKEVDSVVDAYTTCASYSPVISEREIVNLEKQISKKINLYESANLSTMPLLGGIISSDYDIKYDVNLNENILNIIGEMIVSAVMYVDSDERYYNHTLTIPFELAEEIDMTSPNLNISLTLDKMDISTSNQTFSVDATLNVNMDMFNNSEINDITLVKEEKQDESFRDNILIKIYYKEQEESLWDIGKKNHVSVDSILKYNSIDKEQKNVNSTPLLIRK